MSPYAEADHCSQSWGKKHVGWLLFSGRFHKLNRNRGTVHSLQSERMPLCIHMRTQTHIHILCTHTQELKENSIKSILSQMHRKYFFIYLLHTQ